MARHGLKSIIAACLAVGAAAEMLPRPEIDFKESVRIGRNLPEFYGIPGMNRTTDAIREKMTRRKPVHRNRNTLSSTKPIR